MRTEVPGSRILFIGDAGPEFLDVLFLKSKKLSATGHLPGVTGAPARGADLKKKAGARLRQLATNADAEKNHTAEHQGVGGRLGNRLKGDALNIFGVY
jgi:hypothetical protein